MFKPQPEPQPEPQPDRSSLYINNGDVMQTAAVRTAAVCLGHQRNTQPLICKYMYVIIYTDKNECLDSNGQCSDICVNEKPGYHCECNEGELDVDQHTCTGK